MTSYCIESENRIDPVLDSLFTVPVSAYFTATAFLANCQTSGTLVTGLITKLHVMRKLTYSRFFSHLKVSNLITHPVTSVLRAYSLHKNLDYLRFYKDAPNEAIVSRPICNLIAII